MKRLSTEVPVGPDNELDQPGVVSFYNIETIPKSALGRHIGLLLGRQEPDLTAGIVNAFALRSDDVSPSFSRLPYLPSVLAACQERGTNRCRDAKLSLMEPVDELGHRQRIMERLALRVAASGGFLSRHELSAFSLGDGERVRLMDTSRGIWNPRELSATLSIVSSPDGPYDDGEIEGGLFRYDYRAGSIEGDNTKLRRAGDLRLPLILLRKVETGVYIPVFPVYVVHDDVARRQFIIAVDESLRLLPDPTRMSEIERRYAERITRQRLHQSMFRGMVVRAYEIRCAVCRLRHGELLDAAHITADSDETGLAIVSNGLSLCKIHHAAYDRNLLGISPDYRVEINRSLLEEVDGPMLKHGLQEMHGTSLILPSRSAEQPDRDRLEARYDLFRAS